MFHLRLDQVLFFYKIVPFSYFYNPSSVMGQWGSVLMCHIDRGGVRGGGQRSPWRMKAGQEGCRLGIGSSPGAACSDAGKPDTPAAQRTF